MQFSTRGGASLGGQKTRLDAWRGAFGGRNAGLDTSRSAFGGENADREGLEGSVGVSEYTQSRAN
jgi:hypothetical protein